MFSPTISRAGLFMNRCGSSVQHLTMCSYGVRPRRAFSLFVYRRAAYKTQV